jgi:hypothetical protein
MKQNARIISFGSSSRVGLPALPLDPTWSIPYVRAVALTRVIPFFFGLVVMLLDVSFARTGKVILARCVLLYVQE